MPDKSRLKELQIEVIPNRGEMVSKIRADIEWLMDSQPTPAYYEKLSAVLYQLLELIEK